MKHRPDLLFVLSVFLVIGVVVSTIGPKLLKSWDVQAKPVAFAKTQE